ncbi:MAG: anhydro-N-acetylmuramic acid kinase [Nitrospiraceae bacterium]|nr:anhydro-N-acetylmuramic acid kinase [Nitrospiraceae bacterium]
MRHDGTAVFCALSRKRAGGMLTPEKEIFSPLNVIGLMSGTSADGIDASLVSIKGHGPRMIVKLLAFASSTYPRKLQAHILQICESGTGPEVCDLNVTLGERFAATALKLIRLSGLTNHDIHLIGSHGQTLYHHSRAPHRSTLQIGEPAIIAERTGVTTVADFRPRDMAAGGEGAPLTPYAHHILFQHKTRSRLIVNLGGICNVTYLPSTMTGGTIAAFDVGPGNMMINSAITHITKGKARQDTNGSTAAKGRINQALLTALSKHPFLKRRPPKSTGREEFGNAYVQRLMRDARRCKMQNEDFVATVTAFTAQAANTSQRFLKGTVDEVILAGGGTKNHTLVKEFRTAFAPISVNTAEAYEWNSKTIEATAFAIMAYQTIHGTPNNLPSVTGADRLVVMGKILPGRSFRLQTRKAVEP